MPKMSGPTPRQIGMASDARGDRVRSNGGCCAKEWPKTGSIGETAGARGGDPRQAGAPAIMPAEEPGGGVQVPPPWTGLLEMAGVVAAL